MSRPLARLVLLRLLMAVGATSIGAVWPGFAQQPGEPAQLGSPRSDSIKPELDQARFNEAQFDEP